jgi:DUF4097 and DUF4098 domain-containing protein YvlB
MTARLHRTPLRVAAGLLATLVSASACHLNLSLDAEAKDTWTRDYPLAAGGTLEIRNTSGRIEVEAADVEGISLVAERVVKAGTDEAAQQALAALEISETVSADRVIVDSARSTGGISINLSREVNYKIRVPRTANVELRGTNGEVDVTGVEGRFEAQVTNGRVQARGLGGDTVVIATNGAVSLAMARLGRDGVTVETVNGAITVTLPSGAAADLTARVTNGVIQHDGLDLKVIEESRRRLDASIGGGGPQSRLETTNGRIRVQR